ncbi:MAG: ATP-binding protein [Spirosomataceae bacterium]
MKAKCLIIIVLLLKISFSFGQLSKQQVDNWINTWQYTDGAKKDSMLFWSDKLMDAAKKLNYPRAEAFGLRIRGLYYDFSNQATEATKYYLAFLDKTKAYGDISDEMSATSDLVYIYFLTDQLAKAKPLVLSFTTRKDKSALDAKKLSTFYNNLGVIYRNEGKEDSAILAYRQSLKIKETLKDEKGLSNLRINLSSLLINQKKYAEALNLTDANLVYLQKNENKTDLWYNLVNKAWCLEGLKRYKETDDFLQKALVLAKELKSKTFEQQTLDQTSSVYSRRGNYLLAYDNLLKSNAIKSELLNEETNEKIAELQEQHNADERERQNQLLNSQLEAQKNKQTAYIIGIIALLGLTGVIGYSFYKNRKKNELIAAQNQKLKDLNTEKNHLISIVSHDLSSPFSAIKLWINTLNNQSSGSEIEETKANILKTATHGLETIKKVLDIDKTELKEIELEETDIADLMTELFGLFEPQLKAKNITLKAKIGHESERILTDKNLLMRALSNLLSNAIKFSYENNEVIFSTNEDVKYFYFTIKDFGVGIAQNQQAMLFERYANVSSKPTQNESSTGLGLSIVKRIMDEIGGEITFESDLGKGTEFRIKLKK